MSVKGHKKLKGLGSQNLRDHMTEGELIFTALAEMSTRQIAEKVSAKGMAQNKTAAKSGGISPSGPAWRSKPKPARP